MKKAVFLTMALVVALAAMLFVAQGPTDTLAASSSVSTTGDLAVGSTTGTGAAINVSIGFTPKYVIVSNPATTSITNVEWSTGMAAASCLKTKLTTTYNVYSNPTVSCISTYSGSSSAAKGFTIGADTDLNISGKTLYYRAFR